MDDTSNTIIFGAEVAKTIDFDKHRSGLKTLKDITCSQCCKPCDKNFCTMMGIEEHHDVDVNELRQEAIKQREYKFKMALNAPDEATKEFLLGQCAFIEEFFNLEDLK